MYRHTCVLHHILVLHVCMRRARGSTVFFFLSTLFFHLQRNIPPSGFGYSLPNNINAASKAIKVLTAKQLGDWPVSSSSDSRDPSGYTQPVLGAANPIPQAEIFQMLILHSAPCSLKPVSALTRDFAGAVRQTVICFSPRCRPPKFKAQCGRGSGPRS